MCVESRDEGQHTSTTECSATIASSSTRSSGAASHKPGLESSQIAGIVVGSAFVACFGIGVLLRFLMRLRKNPKAEIFLLGKVFSCSSSTMGNNSTQNRDLMMNRVRW